MLRETIIPLSEIKVEDNKPETISQKPLTPKAVKRISQQMCQKLGLHPIGIPEPMGSSFTKNNLFKKNENSL